MTKPSLIDIMREWCKKEMPHYMVLFNGEMVCKCRNINKNMGWANLDGAAVMVWTKAATNLEDMSCKIFYPADPHFFEQVKDAIITWHKIAKEFYKHDRRGWEDE